MNSNSFAPQNTGISPAMLSAFQNQQPKPFPNATLNPSQLMNGEGPLQQMGGPLNPTVLQQQQQPSFNIHNMLQTFNMSIARFQALSGQERQVLGQKYIQMLNQQQQQHNQGQLAQPQVTHPQGGPQVPYERPSSSASNQSQQQNTMLPPPPPRPTTAQGTSQISRPGTSLSHRSPTIPGSGPANLGAMMERPQSRLSHSDGLFKQGQTQPSQPQQPFSNSSSTGQQSGMGMGNLGMGGMNNMGMGNMMMNNMGMNMSGMGMGVPGSPRIGGAGTTAAMGPPGLPRSISGDGMSLNMIGGGSMNMGGGGMNMIGGGMAVNMGNMNNVGAMANMGMGMNGTTARPQSSMGMASGVGGIGSSAGAGGMSGLPGGSMGNSLSGMGMGMNMGMNVDPPSRTLPTSGNMGGQTQATPQTPIRQGSLPPQPSSTNSQPPGIGMSNLGAHSMRQNPMSAGTTSAIGGTGTQSTTPSRRQSLPPGGMGMNVNMTMGGISTSASNSVPTPASPLPSGGLTAGGASNMLGAAQPPQASSQQGLNSSNTLPSTTTTSLGTPAPGASATANAVASTSSTTSSTPIASTSASASNPIPSSSLSNLPHLAALNPSTTNITTVPLLTSERHIRPLSPSEIENVKRWMEVDRGYEPRLRAMRSRMAEEIRDLFKPALVGQPHPPGQPPEKWISTAAPHWWERGGWGSTGSNSSRFRRLGRETFDVRYSNKRDALRGAYRGGRRGLKREGLKLPRKLDPEEANKPEMLVPIRVEFDVEHHKMREAFIWNLNDPVVTPEIFAQSLVEDYNLSSSYHGLITKSIQDQLSDFHAHAFGGDLNGVDDEMPTSPVVYYASEGQDTSVLRGGLDNEDSRWWARWRRKLKREARKAIDEADALKGGTKRKKAGANKREGMRHSGRKKRKTVTVVEDGDDDVNVLADNELDEADCEKDSDTMIGDSEDDEDNEWKPLSVDEIKVNEQSMHEDMRILIKLDIIIASIKLDDQFEWDLDNPMTSPEEFAEVYTQELGLSGEFKTAIAHSIREQVHTYQKSLFLVGHPSDGSAVQDEELKQAFLPSLTSGARPVSEVSLFTPLLNYLSDGEIERTEKEKDKDLNKRRKRNTRGRRGIALPDREPIRTYRTPAIGFPELDAATLALQAAANAPVSRRAAAAAASLTIANMVASENRDDNAPFMTQPITVVAPRPPPMPTQMIAPQPHHQPQQQKDKKGKGLFRAPPFPPSVLRPRAHVSAPTPSTAADASLLPPGSVVDKDLQESGGQMSSQDARFKTVISAKRAKELEREAKEKEFVDGQHPNYIDGVWHCSNCGCPESIAVGRRKGPLGDKSQCGTCGKFWHRHRRPRPVEYNPDPNFHSGLKQKEIDAVKASSTKKRGPAALRAQNASALSTAATPSSIAGADVSEPQTPAAGKWNGDSKDDDRPISPVSTASSASEAPLAHKVKVNGNHHKQSPIPIGTPSKTETTKSSLPISTTAVSNMDSTSGPVSSSAAPSSPTRPHPPAWLSNAMHSMQAKYPNDRFEVMLRKTTASSSPEWRIKCLDCPGKLYTPGPAETLSNYEVHLKNRQHRQRVNERLSGVISAPVVTSTAAAPVGAVSIGGGAGESSAS